jgi:hypothetical protein
LNDISQSPLKYASPYQVTMATSISRHKLENLIKAGIVKAKRVDSQTVVIEWDSVVRYLDSLPDVAQEAETQHDQVTVASAMQSYNEVRRKAFDLFSNAEAQHDCSD